MTCVPLSGPGSPARRTFRLTRGFVALILLAAVAYGLSQVGHFLTKEDPLQKAGGERSNRQASDLILPARGPFADGSSSKLTRCPSLSCSKMPVVTELRWKNHSWPPSSRMKPNPRSLTNRFIVPFATSTTSADRLQKVLALVASSSVPRVQVLSTRVGCRREFDS